MFFMRSFLPTFFVLHASASLTTVLLERGSESDDLSRAGKACQLLKESFPWLVSFPGAEQYTNDTEAFYVSSQQNSTCSIEPTSANDISTIIKLVGRPDIRAPFAVKSRGHAYNLGHSSTPGVQISMARFTDVGYDADKEVVTIGVGLTWSQVYESLEPHGVMVAGGRIDSVGVGGYSLGGGYSWKTNQFGLLIDTIVSFDLILPSGGQVHVTNSSDPDLFFGLKGGLNNFGIVTDITVEAHEQTQVFGGLLTYSEDALESLNTAVSDFCQNNKDPKAQIIVGYGTVLGQFSGNILLFYDSPSPPPGLYDAILSVPAASANLKAQSFVEFMSTFGSGDLGIGPFGGAQHTVPIIQYTKPVLDSMVQEVKLSAARIAEQVNDTIVAVTAAAEPFLNPFSHSRGGAYPHPPSRQVTPMAIGIYYQEDPETQLGAYVYELKKMNDAIHARAVEEGRSRWDDILYPNYALADTPLERMYGSNLKRLQEIAARYDPDRVMSLTGGFRF